MVAWIAFSKVGSTSMSALLAHRATHKGWKKYVPDDDWRLCRSYKLSPGMEPDCADVPNDYVVPAQLGFCELIGTTTGRKCRYMTVLREPISKIVSEWNYFCRDCRETRRFCSTVRSADTPSVMRQEIHHTLEHAMSLNTKLSRNAHGVPLRCMQSCRGREECEASSGRAPT